MKTFKAFLKTHLNLIKGRSMILIISITMLMIFLTSSIMYAQQCNKKEAINEKKPVTSILKECAEKGDLVKIKKIIDENEKLVNARLKNNETILTIVSYIGYYDIAEYLISKDANVHLRNDWDNNALTNASMKGHLKIVKLLLNNGANINSRGNSGSTSLHLAARNQHADVVKLLVEYGCNVDPQNDYSMTPLFFASWGGNPDIIKTLVDNGANVNFSDPDNNTILHNMAGEGHIEGMVTILNADANANNVDDDGYLPLHTAVLNGKPKAVKVLINKTNNLNQKEKHYGNTALHIAAKNGDIHSYRMLTEAGADHNITNNKDLKACDYAINYGYTDLVSYSISKNIAPKKILKMTEENRKTWTQKTEIGNANVYYCGHSGWAVNTQSSVLIFDYWSRNKISETPGLINGSIVPEELKDKKVYVFVSHDHGDHYDTIIYSWQKEIKDITYVYGFIPEKSWLHEKTGYHGPEYVHIEDNQSKKIGDIKVCTHKSNDTGQGFLVEVDGVSIYHPGDHALFTEEDKEGFKKEVDFIANQNSSVDIAFLPVTGCPSRWKKEFIVQGFFYSIDKLNPKQVFPMHAFNREYILYEFAELAKERKTKAKILCVENKGDNFSLNKDLTVKK